MTYLYAGLGIAMLTGIMAIFEMGLSLTGRSLLPSEQDPYFKTGAADLSDRTLLRLLNSNADLNAIGRNKTSHDLCKGILDRIKDLNKGQCVGQNGPYVPLNDFKQDSSGLAFPNACALKNTAQQHRILVVPDLSDPSSPYQLYSCVLQGDQYCRFEEV